MGKKNTVKEANQQSLAAVRQPSVGEGILSHEVQNWSDYIGRGDFTQNPKSIFWNYAMADPAQEAQQAELMGNAGAQGVAALGQGANPNLLAMNKQNLADWRAQRYGAAREQAVNQANANAAGALGTVAQLENQREGIALGSTTSSYNQQLAKPTWWQQLLQNTGQAIKVGAQLGTSSPIT